MFSAGREICRGYNSLKSFCGSRRIQLMKRKHPHQQGTSNYITPEGYKRLRDEFTYLWRVKRPQVTQAVSDAAALGDRSENAEYIYGKRQLREIDRRIRYLSKRLDELVVVDRKPADQERVYFGAWVRLEDQTGNLSQYRIVGPDEFDLDHGLISVDSPLGRALLKKAKGDETVVELPKGRMVFAIVEVSYEPLTSDR